MDFKRLKTTEITVYEFEGSTATPGEQIFFKVVWTYDDQETPSHVAGALTTKSTVECYKSSERDQQYIRMAAPSILYGIPTPGKSIILLNTFI